MGRSQRNICLRSMVPTSVTVRIGPSFPDVRRGVISSHSYCSKPISFISDLTYETCTRVGLVKAYPMGEYDSNGGAYASLPGGARAEAERRR